MDSTRVSSERLQKVLPDALAAIHGVIEKHRVTEEEWSAVLAFLTEVGRQDEFVLLSDVTKTSVLVDAISHEGETGVTPTDVEGPLYREQPPWREKPVKIYEEYEGSEKGDVLFVRGRVTSADGTPISGAVLDIWQTGPDGGYDLWDERQPDYNFRGRFGVEEDGSYEFQTMVPRPYTVPTEGPVGRLLEAIGQHPWRPAHIHFKVEAEGHETLITQVFFPDDPYLENDTIGAVKSALVRPLTRHESEEELTRRDLDAPFYTCEFDITLKPAMSAARA
ncbi:MAG TPA: dioxygenase [Rubrobacteraceae bacterium]|nr:dioxygenase [Rubrobacteraceae bacterium]